MKKILLVSFFAIIAFSVLSAQGNMNWKKHQKLADELFAKAQYFDAAEHYKEAWKLKPNKKELIFKAGESYHIIKDYVNAADAFQYVKDDISDYPLIGLKYARSLKQSNQYDAASRELVYFLSNYKGSDKDIVTEIVQNEIRGCELGIKLESFPDEDINIQHLGSNINTPETEFAPFPFNDETLYYSSTMASRAEIYRSRKVNGEWSRPEKPSNFPKIDNDHFCNGNLSPDGTRFYFTICKSKESWGGLTTQCEIYVTKRKNNKWANPERLRDYVNIDGTTSTHPYVIHQNNTELLYFSSNREGGKGGMDIWYMSRDLRSDDIDFTFPINCGSSVNTKGDEISPFYDKEEGNLYFASNGQVTIGGYDVFSAVGSKSQFEKPENVGTPINSSADDFFFTRTPSRNGGFFVSNRLFGPEKISTLDEDIFSFTDSNSDPKISVKGNVLDKKSNEGLTNIMVSLSQYMTGGNKQFIANKRFENGEYYFEVLPGYEYEIEVQHEGYIPKTYVFSTREEGMRTTGKTIQMERMRDDMKALTGISKPSIIEKVTTPPVETTPKVNTSPSRKVETVSTNNPTTNKKEPTVSYPSYNKKEEVKETLTNTAKENVTTIAENTSSSIKEDMTTIAKEETFEPSKTEITKSIVIPTKEITKEAETKVREIVSNTTTTSTTKPVNSSSRTYGNSSTTNTYSNSVATNNSSSKYNSTTTSAPSTTRYERKDYISNGVRSSAPRHEGTYYKVQIIAVSTHNPFHNRYNRVREIARMDTEYIVNKGLTRVLLADFFSYAEAANALSKVKTRGFERAYLVKYQNGARIGRVR